ncbi:MAG: chromosome segregation protein SMC [Candidatus Stahlbacteria bacterium]|nr:MAG: chromosome segregation protein SMC [Candidatus Stahlbacteria bacterium]
MKIKEIKLYGFKSFPKDTKIPLNAGITAFVGPNGSGKSNIFDALRWVFGEQSMKALRCERIEDLIYVSPDTKDDANFTEVSVTIDNADYFPQFGGEFEIKRRFYKSGESEFFLNRVKCRLQDIQALFLNSGTLTYSFLELSEIEKIIHGDTKEMFSDVSGILKYQERREQTRRRLESTEQDLLRLEDIIHEMQRSSRRLKRQVRQTKLYKELKEEYKLLSLFTLKKEHDKTLEEFNKIQEQINCKDTHGQSILQEIKRLEKERERLKNEMAQIEAKKKETLDQVVAIDEVVERLRKDITEREEEAKQIILSNERTITSIKEKEEILKNNEKRLAEYERRKMEIVSSIETMEASVREEQEQLEIKNNMYFTLKNGLQEKTKIITDFLTEIRGYKQNITKLQFEKDNKETLLTRIKREYSVQKEEIEKKQRTRKQLEEELNGIVSHQEEMAKRLDEANDSLVKSEKKLVDLEVDLNNRQEVLKDCKLVIDTLTRRLKEKGGVREIEERFDKRCQGLFRDNIKVVAGYESVVDICLGDILSFYLLDDYNSQDFDKLPEGRFGFINTRAVVKDKDSMEFAEGLSSVSQFVQIKSSQKILQKYINNYFLVDDFSQANDLTEKYPECGFVTRNGILFKNGMIIIEKGEIGYFKINQSLEEYKKKLETLNNEILFINEEKKRLLSEMDVIKKNIEEERNQLFTANVKKSECSLKLNELIRNLEKIVQEYENIKTDRNSLIKENEILVTQIKEIEKETEKTKNKSREIEDEKNDLIEKSQDTEKEVEEYNSILNERRMELVAIKERRSSIVSAIDQLKNEVRTVELEIGTLKQDTAAKAFDVFQAQILSLKEKLDSEIKKKADIKALLPEKVIEEITQSINNIFDQLAEKQKIHEEIQNTVLQLKYESFQLNHKEEETAKRAQEDFKVNLKDYIPEEEIPEPEAKLLQIKGKLEKLGEVNPLSLELYENEKKRLDEFLEQRDDIITARRSLLNSIEELNTRARERFVDIFGQVKKEFNFVFSNFFEGGAADLVLSDPDNPLTSKVDIVVRMKGKRLKTINQLSGGERTLLAISLLLAFYLVKPAPFCILDEIDAPLDDVNVVSFNKFLRDLSQRTQVVIITHNRATMEYTDYLYGLTMEKPGQSKIISAKLADLEKIGSLE